MSATNPAGTIAAYSVRKANGASSYIWTVPTGATIVSHPNGAGADDTLVHVIFDAGFTAGTISVASSNGCGASTPRTLNITTLQPMAPGGITAVETGVCPSRSYTYSLAYLPINATGINWAVPAGGTILSGQGTTSITVAYTDEAISGNVTAVAVSNCGASGTRKLSVKLPACTGGKPVTKTAVAESEFEVAVYPNPSQHLFNVKIKSRETGKIQVRVLDVMGREVSRKMAAGHETIMLGSELKAGTYFIEVVQNGKRSVTKVIRQ
ncbi:MAG: T9SS type A sorting domain-containing protein [Sphingobacteriales bacterium]|nr:MAG: T9SS type A sorting domain-containing protein [Sphingobacteriales bacterium]